MIMIKIAKYILLVLVLGYLFLWNSYDKDKLKYLSDRVKYLEQRMSNLEQQNIIRLCTVTAYSPTKRECDATPWITASGKRPRIGTVAVSRDLFYLGWVFGSRIYIEGLGVYRVNDLMHSRWENRIDVFMSNTKLAKRFGKKEIKVVLLEGG